MTEFASMFRPIRLLMAAPIALVLAVMGATVGYCIQYHGYSRRELTALLILLAFYPAVMMGSESIVPASPPEFTVRTAIEVNPGPQSRCCSLLHLLHRAVHRADHRLGRAAAA